MVFLLGLLGVVAGVMTTLTGMGGGILLLLTISAVMGPKVALAATAPALLVGNLHRAWMYRAEVDARVARAFVLGALPGSLVGGALLSALPHGVVTWLMVAMTALGVTRAFKLWSWRPSAAAMTPAGFGVGALAATSGGAGFLVAPLFMAAGLRGTQYVSTVAVGAVAMHLGRIASYAATGLVTRTTLAMAAVLTATILVGNLLGRSLRRHVTPARGERLELGALLACVALSLAGLGR